MKAYKLFRKRKDGTLGSLFINRRQKVPIGKWLKAEAHKTKGYAFRPGWHAGAEPNAPHLSEKNRVWCEVELKGVRIHKRPAYQGGEWLLGDQLKVVKELSPTDVEQLRTNLFDRKM